MISPDPLETRAIIVGIEQYDVGPSWNLDGPAFDACKFARWLQECGVPTDRINVAISSLPRNRDEVDRALTGFQVVEATAEIVRSLFVGLQLSSSDLLIVYWGGHGVQDGKIRRLIFADATEPDKRTFALTTWVEQLRTTRFQRHPRQVIIVDACLNEIAKRTWKGLVSADDPGAGDLEHARDQAVIYAASPGERAKNVDTLKTGLFSKELRARLTWPIDPGLLNRQLAARFTELRAQGITSQTPSMLWYRDRSTEDTLVFERPVAVHAFGRAPEHALLDDARIEELKTLLRGGELPANLVAIFNMATRMRVRRNAPGLCSLDDLLIELRRQVDPRPLLEFVLHIAAEQEGSTARRLKNWVTLAAEECQVDPHQLHELRKRSRLAILLVKVTYAAQRDGWLVTAWMFVDGRSWVECAEVGPVGWDKVVEVLQDQVTNWIDDFEPETGSAALSVEFLLPIDLLDLAVETIEVTIDSKKYDLGSVCSVVVRSLDRVDQDAWHDAWWDKWDELGRASDDYDENAICWIEEGFPKPEHLGLCVALAHADKALREAAFRFALASGTPLAVWHRGTSRRLRKHAIRGVLRNGGLRDLPKVALAQRIASRQHDAPPSHGGRDLVLLWDDPRRLPDIPDYHQPRAELMPP